MRLRILALIFGLSLTSCLIMAPCSAQETQPPKEQPQETESQGRLTGFQWLKQFEGRWSTDFDGTMISRLVAERWVVSEIHFQTGLFSMQVIGYDTEAEQFVGTWIDGTSSHIWHYTGFLDEAGKVLIMEAEGPDLTDPTRLRKYRDTYQFVTANQIASITYVLDDDGQWQVFNEGKMTRKAD